MRNKKLIALFFVLCTLAVIIVINSVLFSVQNIYAYCYNYDSDAELEAQVIESSGLKRGGSIFILNENEIAQNIESSINNLRVINIERKFPNTVYINFVLVEDYLKVRAKGKIYYISNSGRVTKIAPASEDTEDGLIEFIVKGEPLELTLNSYFETDNPDDGIALRVILSALERIMARSDLLQMFEFIDITRGYVYLKTTAGAFFELMSLDLAFEKLHSAYSVYLSYGAGAKEQTEGTYIITGRDANSILTNYTTKNRYIDGI